MADKDSVREAILGPSPSKEEILARVEARAFSSSISNLPTSWAL